jgi:Holliday junction DNA helicase RuvA
MFYFVKGTVAHMETGLAVIDCGGVGYACRASANTLSTLAIGEETTLYTHFAVREDAAELFGFADKAEMHVFRMLLGVSGVGAKSALGVLSDLSPQEFAMCVATGDAKRLQQAPGVGAKTAQRIVLELKDKVAKSMPEAGKITVNQVSSAAADSSAGAQALSALCVLGFTPGQAAEALADVDAGDTAEMIKQALKRLAKR